MSLQPSVTVTLRDLGVLDRLVACTKYCVDVCPEVRETGCIIVEDSWSAKAEQIMAAKPDLVIASVPYRLDSVAEILKERRAFPWAGARNSLDDIYKDIMMIARVMGLEARSASQRGTAVVARMEREVQVDVAEDNGLGAASGLLRRVGQAAILSQTWVADWWKLPADASLASPASILEEDVAGRS